MNNYAFGNCQIKGVYFDEENRRHLNSIRLAYAQSAAALAENGKTEEAKKLLHKCDSMMNKENMPYAMVGRYQQHNQISLQMLYACYRAGDNALADKISKNLTKDMQQQAAYYQSLPDNKREALSNEEDKNNQLMQGVNQLEQQFKLTETEINTPTTLTKNGRKVIDSPKATTDTAKP